MRNYDLFPASAVESFADKYPTRVHFLNLRAGDMIVFGPLRSVFVGRVEKKKDCWNVHGMEFRKDRSPAEISYKGTQFSYLRCQFVLRNGDKHFSDATLKKNA